MAKTGEDTPLLKQYFSIKAQHPEAILLYRVGDFYETYADDAVTASKVLGLVLTRRSNADKGSTPMAGFPHHAIENYLQKLIRAGYKVAVCDQLEDPNLVKTKLVKRGVTEILTPGIAFGEGMLDQKENNFLCALLPDSKTSQWGAAFLDASTGTFKVAQGQAGYISTLVSSFNPKEMVIRREDAADVEELCPQRYLTRLDEWAFVYEADVEKLKSQLKTTSLKGFAVEVFPLAVRCAGALIFYLEQTQHSGLGNICEISRIDEGKFVWMDRFTVRNLELFNSGGGEGAVSLVDVIDNCCTPMGSRLLRSYLSMPLVDTAAIESRQDVVQALFDDPSLRDELRDSLSRVGDMERTISRVATGRIQPRELLQLSRSLSNISPIRQLCGGKCVALDKRLSKLKDTDAVMEKIRLTLKEDCAAAIGKGEVVAAGVNEDLDRLRSIRNGGREYLDSLLEREIQNTGIQSLKIGSNNVFGYYFEVRNSSRDMVPQDWIRKQTLVNAERYITKELKDYEEQILGAEGEIYRIETEIYAALVAFVQKYIRDIQANCAVTSDLDVLSGFAFLAEKNSYCRPVVDKSLSIDIKEGRHPVIETLMKAGEEYVPNDIFMDSKSDQVMILTGPNMAGKSALLRQTALIVLMAQIGSFVPASSAHIGYCDKIFTRVGASDNISRGESTFMVEMLETAMIMHNLSARSLVLLDEIGRGTSTYDGMSIARALVEYLHQKGKGAKTLFATHYHELNDLEKQYPRVKNYHIAVKEEGRQVLFLRKLCPGGVAHSFGLHVARMAGMPQEILDAAEKNLRELEIREKHAGNLDIQEDGSMQLSFFQLDDPTLSAVKEKLQSADLNNMTPLQAFDLLRSLKDEVGAS